MLLDAIGCCSMEAPPPWTPTTPEVVVLLALFALALVAFALTA